MAKPQISPSRSEAAAEVVSANVAWEVAIPLERSLFRFEEINGSRPAPLPDGQLVGGGEMVRLVVVSDLAVYGGIGPEGRLGLRRARSRRTSRPMMPRSRAGARTPPLCWCSQLW